MEEIWKAIEGYEGLYEVSNLGRVRSFDRLIERPHPRNTSMTMTYRKKGRILKMKINPSGYLYVDLWKDKKPHTVVVHRLVATAFIPNLENLPEVNHIDEDKTNPVVTNLEWVTHSGNMRHGTCGERMGRKHWKAIVQMTMDGKFAKRWDCAQHASEELGLQHSAIISVCRGKANSHGGFRWRYADENGK
jgi:hypothetical protein